MFKKILRENKPRNLKKDIRNMNFFFLLSPLTDPGGFFVFFLVTNQHSVKIVRHIEALTRYPAAFFRRQLFQLNYLQYLYTANCVCVTYSIE